MARHSCHRSCHRSFHRLLPAGVLTAWLVLLPAVALGLVVGAPVRAEAATSPSTAAPWAWPLSRTPEIARPFAPPATRYGRGHRGVDLAAPPGAAVLAAGAGTVGYAGMLAGRGVVTVVHGSLRTTYEPVTASVVVGQQVRLGQTLGTLSTGHPGCLGVCLHWGLLRRRDYLDPLALLRRAPSRLLPLADSAPADGRSGGRSTEFPKPAPGEAAPEPVPRLQARRASKDPPAQIPAGLAVAAGSAAVLVMSRRPGP